jgi:tetratricopeptide (TPR) repeat protein
MSLLTFTVAAQKESSDVRNGNKLYKSGKFTDAENAYRKGLAVNSKSFEATYNLGNALFKQKKYPEALEQYTTALALKPTEKMRIAAGFHNTGNALLADNKIEESINAYEMALKSNPTDNDTRYNLAFAQMKLKNNPQKNEEKESEADKIKKRADELIEKKMYKEAYNLMKEGEKTDKSLLQYSDFTNRILDIIKLKK